MVAPTDPAPTMAIFEGLSGMMRPFSDRRGGLSTANPRRPRAGGVAGPPCYARVTAIGPRPRYLMPRQSLLIPERTRHALPHALSPRAVRPARARRPGDAADGPRADAGQGDHRLQGRPRVRPARREDA